MNEELKEIARSSGIDLVGITHGEPFSNYLWGDSLRRSPTLTMGNAKSIIVAGLYIGGLTLPAWEDGDYGRTSRLYLSGYFLDVIEPLKPLARFLTDRGYSAKICDSSRKESSSLPLKLAALRAGLGWQGKNTLLINKKYGSYLALGGIITDAELEDEGRPQKSLCGNCTNCRTACPMGALDREFNLNWENCLSYLLQEEDIPHEAIIKSGNRVGDCEICQDICPWNRKHRENPLETKLTLEFRKMRQRITEHSRLEDLIRLDEENYRTDWGAYGTGIPFSLFKRNVQQALDDRNRNLPV